MTTKTSRTNSFRIIRDKKILIGILVIIILVISGWWIWSNYYQKIPCDKLEKRISSEISKLDKGCRVDGDCKTVELLRGIRTDGVYPICVNKGEEVKETRSLQELQHKTCKKFLPYILIKPAPFYGCECKNTICTEIREKEKQVTITTDKTEYEQGETVKYTVKNNKDTPVWIEVLLPPMGAGPLFAIEKKIKEAWTYIGYPSFCALGYEPPEKELIKIESGEEYKESWDQTFCNIVAITMEQPNPPMENLSRGIYRIKYEYSNIERMGIADMVDMYSNEFIIQ